ncbi:MAG: pyridoxine 5'-phosphate synthase [Rhodospirillales bacterium 12-54-5]|nr:MAG: pyridoxine 5'-phosphate synthase [Rhodospirillales bacterium 12-54-5]
MSKKIRLGVNIDHVATLRNARGGAHPCPVAAAVLAAQAGADGITAHLREDRRHIRDDDMRRIRNDVALPLNFEMAATAEMHALALEIRPHAVCLVPEKREERTTEGGLNVARQEAALKSYIAPLVAAGIRVSLFIDPEIEQIEASARIGAPVVELHTGAYAQFMAQSAECIKELVKIQSAAAHGAALGLEIHAGHGLTYTNVGAIAAIPEIRELNIGHFLIGEAVFVGLENAIRHMRNAMDEAR